jgi:hypothetical protein
MYPSKLWRAWKDFVFRGVISRNIIAEVCPGVTLCAEMSVEQKSLVLCNDVFYITRTGWSFYRQRFTTRTALWFLWCNWIHVLDFCLNCNFEWYRVIISRWFLWEFPQSFLGMCYDDLFCGLISDLWNFSSLCNFSDTLHFLRVNFNFSVTLVCSVVVFMDPKLSSYFTVLVVTRSFAAYPHILKFHSQLLSVYISCKYDMWILF